MKGGTRLYINITNRCNRSCPFCCMYSGNGKRTNMKFDTFRSIIDGCDGKFELQLEGGEPLLHQDIFLFIEYAISTGRCMKVIILSNGVMLDIGCNRDRARLKRLTDIHKWYNIPFEIKVSVNYYLLEMDPEHLEKVSRLANACQYFENFDIVLNTRKRGPEDDEIDDEIEELGMDSINHSFYLQSYGKLKGNPDYDEPVIVQNIENWAVYSVDGLCFQQDLVARSEHEKGIE